MPAPVSHDPWLAAFSSIFHWPVGTAGLGTALAGRCFDPDETSQASAYRMVAGRAIGGLIRGGVAIRGIGRGSAPIGGRGRGAVPMGGTGRDAVPIGGTAWAGGSGRV